LYKPRINHQHVGVKQLRAAGHCYVDSALNSTEMETATDTCQGS